MPLPNNLMAQVAALRGMRGAPRPGMGGPMDMQRGGLPPGPPPGMGPPMQPPVSRFPGMGGGIAGRGPQAPIPQVPGGIQPGDPSRGQMPMPGAPMDPGRPMPPVGGALPPMGVGQTMPFNPNGGMQMGPSGDQGMGQGIMMGAPPLAPVPFGPGGTPPSAAAGALRTRPRY